jgi:hypothetical protein
MGEGIADLAQLHERVARRQIEGLRIAGDDAWHGLVLGSGRSTSLFSNGGIVAPL